MAEALFLQVQDLTMRYGDFLAVDRLNFGIAKGEFAAILGPSGCGKTSLLRMIAGLVRATSGNITVGGRDLTHVPPYRRDMGLVFQNYALFPHMTVAENVAFGLKMRKVARAEIAERVKAAIAMVHLAGREDHLPSQLSGGQQQRVALARALVIQPSVLLLDEPLSNLDAKLRDEMRMEIREIQQQLGITAIFVTHDQAEALTMCDKVVLMNAGHIEQMGSPLALYDEPKTAFAASFIGRSNRFRSVVQDGVAEFAGLRIPAPAGVGGPVDIMIRPHRIAFVALDNERPAYALAGRVIRAIFAGELLQYEVSAGGNVFLVEESTSTHRPVLAPGSAVTMHWLACDTFVFGT